jgi:site-specific DNA-methyltransferase (adenine-specific)
LEQAAAYLVECQDLDEVKALRDKAEPIRLYQKKVDQSGQAAIVAGEIKVRAERRLGELIAGMPKARNQHECRSDGVTGTPTLADLGVGKMESSRCQAIAAVPKEEFERAIDKAKQSGRAPTSNELRVKGQTHQRIERKKTELEEAAKKPTPVTKAWAWEVKQGDCLEGLESIEEGSVRLIFADPPYNIGIEYGDHYDDSRPADQYEAWCGEWLAAAFRALTDDGSLWLLVNHEWARNLCSHAEDIGFHLRQWLTWYESFGVNTTRMFNRCSRPLLWLTKDSSRFVFNPDAVSRESDRQAKYGDSRANPDGKLWDDVWGINPPIPRLVGTAEERMPGFPTQLPLALLRPIVGCASHEGDLVIDPFSGSGTTGAACIELDRRFIGFELSEEFADLSRLRLTAREREVHVA